MILLPIPLILASTPIEFQPIDVVAATTLSFERIAFVEEQPDEQTEDSMTIATRTWGKKDTWRWGLQGGYAKDVKHSDNTLSIYGVEFEYFLEDDLSLDLGFFGMDIDQDGPNANGFNFTLQLRWHFVSEDQWSIFMEG